MPAAQKSFFDIFKKGKVVSGIVGILLIILVVVLSILIPSPTPYQTFVFRVLLALGVGALGPMLVGTITVAVKYKEIGELNAAGALALFIIVFLAPYVIDYISPGTTPTPTPSPVAIASPISVNTVTPTQVIPSDTPTFTQTYTPTLTQTATVTVPPGPQYCLMEDLWRTNILHPPMDSVVSGLLRLNQWGIIEDSQKGRNGFSFIWDGKNQETNGVFLITYEHEVKHHVKFSFQVTVHDLTTTGDCGGDYQNGSCAANLMIGIGSPLGPDYQSVNGRYIAFRDLDGIDGWICGVESLYGDSSNCTSPVNNMIPLHKDTPYSLVFEITNSRLDASLNDGQQVISFYSNEFLPDQVYPFLWFGYHFKSTGKIDSFISCPEITT